MWVLSHLVMFTGRFVIPPHIGSRLFVLPPLPPPPPTSCFYVLYWCEVFIACFSTCSWTDGLTDKLTVNIVILDTDCPLVDEIHIVYLRHTVRICSYCWCKKWLYLTIINLHSIKPCFSHYGNESLPHLIWNKKLFPVWKTR